MTKAAWPREPSSRSTEAITTWTSAMPPLVAHAFWPLRTHSSLASSYLAVVRIAETSEPASGSDEQKAATFGSSAVPKHCGIHSPNCSGVPCPKIAATAREVPKIAHPDTGVAPEQLLVDDRERQAGLVGPELGQAFESVEADLGGLLDHRPRRLLALVPLRRGGPDDVLGEAVDPVAEVLLVLVQLEGELRALGRPGRRRRPPPRRGLPPPPLPPTRSSGFSRPDPMDRGMVHGIVSMSKPDGSDVAQVEGPQALLPLIGAVEKRRSTQS